MGIMQPLQRPFWKASTTINLPRPPYNQGSMLYKGGNALYEVSYLLFNGEMEKHAAAAASA